MGGLVRLPRNVDEKLESSKGSLVKGQRKKNHQTPTTNLTFPSIHSSFLTLQMLNPVIFIKDPIKYDYSQFIISLLPKFINCNRIDLVILCQITESNQLNEILCFYYQLIRNHKNNGDTDGDTDSLPMFDYRFEINILFNLSTKN